jgi:hypothetical protein
MKAGLKLFLDFSEKELLWPQQQRRKSKSIDSVTR